MMMSLVELVYVNKHRILR